MATIGIWALFAVFGAVSALYVTVVGFALSAVAAVALLGLFSAVAGAGLGVWTLGGSLIALQVGYVACIVAMAAIGHGSRLPRKNPRRLEGDLHIKHD
jgi:hypothetical protein